MKTKLTAILLLTGIFNLAAQEWSWAGDDLSYDREGLSATVLNDNIYYSGGRIYNWGAFSNVVDIYNVTTDVWSTVDLESTPRWQTSAVSCNDRVFFAGGNNYPGDDSYSDVDIYNSTTNEWTVENLSNARILMGTTAHMNKAFFAGGLNHGIGGFYNVIDIYDTENGQWSTKSLSEHKAAVGAAAAGGKVFFAGGATDYGVFTDLVEIYDIEDDDWTYTTLTVARAYIAAVAYENKVYFAGGTTGDAGSDVVDVYNVDDGYWEDPQTLSFPRIVRALNVGNALVFSGECEYIDANGLYVNANGMIDIYYPEIDEWDNYVSDLEPARIWYACTSCDNSAYYAGGFTYEAETTDTINIIKYNIVPYIQESGFSNSNIQVYPNPFSATLQIEFILQQSGEVKLSIYDNYGKQVGIVVNEYQQKGNQQVKFNSEKLQTGIYFCVLQTREGIQTTKMIKQD